MQLWTCDVPPNYTYRGYTENCLSESLLTDASGTSSSAVDLYMAHSTRCWEARRWMVLLFFSPRSFVSFLDKKKKKEKKTRKCVCNCEQHMFIDSMGQGLSAATHQFSNCLILLTCVSVCVYVGECASVHACWLLFFLKKCQCLLWLLCTTDLLYWQISCIWLSVMFMMNF